MDKDELEKRVAALERSFRELRERQRIVLAASFRLGWSIAAVIISVTALLVRLLR